MRAATAMLEAAAQYLAARREAGGHASLCADDRCDHCRQQRQALDAAEMDFLVSFDRAVMATVRAGGTA